MANTSIENWQDLKNGVSVADADDINLIAHETKNLKSKTNNIQEQVDIVGQQKANAADLEALGLSVSDGKLCITYEEG